MPSSASAAARVFTPENRLAKVLSSLDAPSQAELIAGAQAQVASMRSAVRGYVEEKVRVILRCAAGGEMALFEHSREIETAAINIAEVAGAAGMMAIGEIARGISAMLARLRREGAWHGEALMVHVSSLTLASSATPLTPSEETMMLGRLATMRRAIGVTE